MSHWYTLSLLALIFMGTQRFLYKVSAEKKCNTAVTTCSFMATVAVLSGVLFFALDKGVSDFNLLLAVSALNSISFAIGTMTHMEALKTVPAGVVYPLIRLNVVIVVVFSILFFDDHLSIYQGLGVVTALCVMVILTRERHRGEAPLRGSRTGMALVFVSLICGAVASVSAKFAAMYVDKMAFMALSYLMGTGFSLKFRKRLGRGIDPGNFPTALLIGLGMGLINFAGFYSLLMALSRGPLSIIMPIVGLHFVIAIALSAVIYREPLTRSRMIGIGLAVVSVVLLKL